MGDFTNRRVAKILSDRFTRPVPEITIRRYQEKPSGNGSGSQSNIAAMAKPGEVAIEERDVFLAAAFLRVVAGRAGCSVGDLERAVELVKQERWRTIYRIAASGGGK